MSDFDRYQPLAWLFEGLVTRASVGLVKTTPRESKWTAFGKTGLIVAGVAVASTTADIRSEPNAETDLQQAKARPNVGKPVSVSEVPAGYWERAGEALRAAPRLAEPTIDEADPLI